MEMEILCYGTEWTKNFNRCSRNWIKIEFCHQHDDVDEDDLDTVDADEDAEYEAFIEELYSPSD